MLSLIKHAKPSLMQTAQRLPSRIGPISIAARLTQVRKSSDDAAHTNESYEDYTVRLVNFFDKDADDLFELSRGLNNAFNTDLVPAPEVLVAAIKAARRLNSFALAARTVEALKEKLDGDAKVYEAYLQELKPTLDEYGVPTPEELGR